MAYPDQSSALGPGRSLWWGYARDNGQQNFCAINGADFVVALRRTLGLSPIALWDASVASALAASARGLAGSDAGFGALANTILADSSSRLTRAETLAFALWITYYQPHGLRLDRIVVMPNTVPPPWDRTANPAGVGMLCWNPTLNPQPEADDAAAVAASVNGIRLAPGEAAPTRPSDFANGLPGVSNTLLAVLGVGFAGFLAYVATRKKR